MNSAEQVFELLQLGEGTFLSTCFIFSNLESDSFFLFPANRHFGETNMNIRSSRSHTIFRMVLNIESPTF